MGGVRTIAFYHMAISAMGIHCVSFSVHSNSENAQNNIA